MKGYKGMMRQYCRYCAFCVTGNGIYCTCHEKELSESYIKHTNTCKDFAMSELGDVDTGRKYKPHGVFHGKQIDGQMDFTEYLGMPYQFDNMTGSMNL